MTFTGVPAFDIDPDIGFMALTPRLPAAWDAWEDALSGAINSQIQIGEKPNITPHEMLVARDWRARVAQMPVLPTGALSSLTLRRRAHLVLAFLLHFYVHSLPPTEPIIIPPSISIPIVQISNSLELPPVLTYSDTVLYNWDYKIVPNEPGQKPTFDNLRSQTLFTGTRDEEEFYLCSARIEICGVKALEIVQRVQEDIDAHETIVPQHIASYLRQVAGVIDDMRELLLSIHKLCRPEQYYNVVRQWIYGEDSDPHKRKWVFAGLKDYPDLAPPTALSGPSAGQSSLVHALDVFLGVDHQSATPNKPSYMLRMQTYMPKKHRMFLDHLAKGRSLRALVKQSRDTELCNAFNEAVLALKKLRDAHMVIATLYVVGPARRAARAAAAQANIEHKQVPSTLQGTGGTDLIIFLKGTRSRTTETLLPPPDCPSTSSIQQ